MYKVEIPSENIQNAAIMRRRKLDDERKNRIFDPMVRVLGVDVESLDTQVQIKKTMKMHEIMRERAFDNETLQTNQLLQLMDEESDIVRGNHLKAMNEFRATQQRPYQRRDWDLYDPDALKKDYPGRIGDDDPRCGVSGAQRFEGEDLKGPEREKLQKEQRNVWAREQLYEQEVRRMNEADEKKRYEEFQLNMKLKAEELQRASNEATMDRNFMDKEYNQQLAAWKHHMEATTKAREQQQNYDEIMTQMNGEFLTETPDAFNIGGGHKIRVDLFKGITPAQKKNILTINEYQRIEAEMKRDQQKREQQKWALQEASTHRAASLLDLAKQRKGREVAIQIRQENENKAQHDKMKWMYIDKVLYTNEPTPEYFAQFNTTSR